MSQPLHPHRRLATVDTVLPPGAAPEGTRGVILAESLGLFAQHGYGSTSIRDIAKLVGLKAASLYSHYPSKEHILIELIRIGHHWHLRHLKETVMAAEPEPRAQLMALVRAHVRSHAQFAMLAVVSHTELHVLSPEAAEPLLAERRQSERLLIDIIQRGINLGVFDVPDPELAMAAIAAMGVRVAHWYSPGGSRTIDQISDEFALYACRLLNAKG